MFILVFPTYLEEMIAAGGMAGSGMSDNFSSGSSNSSFESVGESSRSFTPLSDSSNDASYDAGGNSDPENLGAWLLLNVIYFYCFNLKSDIICNKK